ncbi:hypothetical protein JF50_25475 [Pseudoalteromonas luteoviolacea]|uniref:DUF86 domain-containing protein n=1 Tax=Pseudoalteromonas luteoviolacea TaxID=43657 RepID=A0A0C1ML45_9GAMM|nr:hypothetical protein JF50_25475 [Pseudoalteromonas luteoviolacea]
MVLNSHLIIEELIDLLNEKIIRNQAPYKKAKFTFNHKLCLLEALYNDDIESWVYHSCRQLNSLRNTYAHILEPDKSEEKIRAFLNVSYRCNVKLEEEIVQHLRRLKQSDSKNLCLIEIQQRHYDSTKRFPLALRELVNNLLVILE